MPHDLTLEITFARGTIHGLRECHGCGGPTGAVVNVIGLGEVLATLPICDGCHGKLAASGITIEAPPDRTVEELVAGGMSERLARLVARRWPR